MNAIKMPRKGETTFAIGIWREDFRVRQAQRLLEIAKKYDFPAARLLEQICKRKIERAQKNKLRFQQLQQEQAAKSTPAAAR